MKITINGLTPLLMNRKNDRTVKYYYSNSNKEKVRIMSKSVIAEDGSYFDHISYDSLGNEISKIREYIEKISLKD